MSSTASDPTTLPEQVEPIHPPQPTPTHPAITTAMNTTSRRSSTSSTTTTSTTESFHSAHDNPYTSPSPLSIPNPSTTTSPTPPTIHRYTPSEENLHLTTSTTLKSEANTHFSRGDYTSALSTYDRAIAALPIYLDYELAVLQSNIAACYLRMEEWREVVEACEKGMKKLDATDTDEDEGDGSGSGNVVELEDGIADEEESLNRLEAKEKRKADVLRIKTKLLLRRARARYMLGTTDPGTTKPSDTKNPFAQAQSLTSTDTSTTSRWSHLTAAQTDYNLLSTAPYFSALPASDQKTVRSAVAVLPGLVEQAKEKEVAEMMGKLKELGNGILKPFGLSTDMFRMEKDEKSGGMSLRFDGGSK